MISNEIIIVQKNILSKFSEIATENINDIEAELARTLKRKTKKNSILGSSLSSSVKELRIRQFIKSKLKLSRKIESKSLSKLTSSIKASKFINFIKASKLISFVKIISIKLIKLFKLFKFTQIIIISIEESLKKRENMKQILKIEDESQEIIKKDSSAIEFRKKQKVVLSSTTNHNIFIISSDFEGSEITKHLKLLKNFLMHLKAYRTMTMKTLEQIRPLLKGNSSLKSEYERIRVKNNELIEQQAILQGNLKNLMKET